MPKPLTLAIASGKGGTGKTTVAVNLAQVWAGPVQVLDCDVEEPNDHLFLTGPVARSETITVPVPRVDETRCDGCGECSRFCAYHAIVTFGTAPLVFPDLCHGCGGCIRVCPRQALSEEGRRIGVVDTSQVRHITLVQGRLDIGRAMAPPLIRAVKARQQDDMPAIRDTPPGTACPVVTTVQDADFVVLVTEPTAFGLHDLKLIVDVLRQLGRRFGVVVNRMGIGDDRVHRFCHEQAVSILAEIPDDRRAAEACSQGRLLVDALPEFRRYFEEILNRVRSICGAPQEVVDADIRI